MSCAIYLDPLIRPAGTVSLREKDPSRYSWWLTIEILLPQGEGARRADEGIWIKASSFWDWRAFRPILRYP